MLAPRLSPDRLEAYLLQLSPEASAFLVREIERHRTAGGDDPTYEIILDAIRRLARIQGSAIGRLSTPLRLFCEPFQELLIDERLGARAPLRVARSSIAPVWKWLSGPHGPHTVRSLINKLTEASDADDRRRIRALHRELVQVMADAIDTEIERGENSRRHQAQLVALLDGKEAVRDAATMASAFRAFDALARLRTAIAPRIVAFSNAVMDEIESALSTFDAQAPGKRALAFAVILARIASPTEALRLGIRALSTEDASQLAESDYAPIGELILGDLAVAAHRVDRLVRQRASAMETIEAVERYHRLASGIEHEIQISPLDAWGRELASCRRMASEALESELRRLPDQISNLFRPYINGRSAKSLPLPDQTDLDAVLQALSTRRGCRQFMDELSLHEVMMRCDDAVPSRLTMITDGLINDLRTSAGERQSVLNEWLEVAVSVTSIAMGSQDARLIARSGQVASAHAKAQSGA